MNQTFNLKNMDFTEIGSEELKSIDGGLFQAVGEIFGTIGGALSGGASIGDHNSANDTSNQISGGVFVGAIVLLFCLI